MLDPARTAEERLTDLVTAGVASHTSAAALHRLGDLLDDQPEITLPHRKQSRRGVRLHRATLSDRDITLVDGLPTTTAERTVADLLRDGHDPDHVAAIIGQGMRRGAIDLNVLAEQVRPLARRHGQPDGHAFVEHLLDLVGLSSSALARDLVNSPAGQELLAAGRAGALSDLVASLMPTMDITRMLGLDKISTSAFVGIDVSKVIGESAVLAAIRPFQGQLATSVVTPKLQATLASLNTPAVRAAIRSVRSPAFRAAEQQMASGAGRQASRAESARIAQTDEPEEDH